jgi:hypothetical protein
VWPTGHFAKQRVGCRADTALDLSGDWPRGSSGFSGSVCRRSIKMVGGSVFKLLPAASLWPGSAWKLHFVTVHLRWEKQGG